MDAKQKTFETPRVDGFKILANLNGSLKEVESKLRTISFLEIVCEKECVNAAYIESRDIEKNPYSFGLFKFKKKTIEVLYSIPPNIAPKKRKLEMVRYFLNMATLLGPLYSISASLIYQLLDGVLKEMNEYVSEEYNTIYTQYGKIKKDYETIMRRFARLQDENEELRRQNYEIQTKNNELLVHIKELETMSTETLQEKIEEWIQEHGGEIRITQFSKFHRVPESQVEKALDTLVREGYIQPVK